MQRSLKYAQQECTGAPIAPTLGFVRVCVPLAGVLALVVSTCVMTGR